MIPIETIHSLEKGRQYLLSHTRPVYDQAKKRFRPDYDRFLNPKIVSVTFGGFVLGDPRHCWVCGRMGKNYYVFVRNSDFKEMFVSAHCLRHPSTKLWSPECPKEVIEDWYSQMFEEMRVDDS